MNRLPVLRIAYNASKLTTQTVFNGAEQVQTPVTLELWQGVRVTSFKTGTTTADGREFVFIPTALNPTTCFLVELNPADMTKNDETAEDAFVRILSRGFGEGNHESHVSSVSTAARNPETTSKLPRNATEPS